MDERQRESKHNFNPRSDERSDDLEVPLSTPVPPISIHAPTNGATNRLLFGMVDQAFQSTLRRTERHIICHFFSSYYAFQSTLRRTERLLEGNYEKIYFYFNPRSDERSDVEAEISAQQLIISIHAPTNGATHILRNIQNIFVISIHAPTNGATIYDFESGILPTISIHAPTNGATHIYSRNKKDTRISIHAPTNGATI